MTDFQSSDSGRDDRAEYVWGVQVALWADIDPDDYLNSLPDSEIARLIAREHVKNGKERPFTLRDCEVPLPVGAMAGLFDEVPTRAEIAADAEDLELEDPHVVAVRLKAERAHRKRQENAERATARPTALADIMLSISGLATVPPPTPLVDGFMYRGTLVQLAGHPGDGKTFAMLGMSCAVALGKSWNGSDVPEARPVVYVAGEGSSGLYTRVAAWAEYNGLSASDLEDRLHVIPRAVQLGEPDDMAQLRDIVGRLGAGLVVFDTRARCTVGLEENSATDQGRAVSAADRLIESTGATVAVVHHLGAASQRGRGSTAWDGAVYSDLILGKTKDGSVLIECAKHKDAPDGCKHVFQLETFTVGLDAMPGADLRRRTSLVLTAADPLTGAGSATATAVLAMIVETAPPEGLTGAQVAAFAAERDLCGKSTAYSTTRSLVLSGHLRNVGTPSRARYAPDPAGGRL